MFNKLKQKIADGVEGVSPGRQTPLRSGKEEVLLPFRYKRLSPEHGHHNNHIRKYNSTLDNSSYNSTLDNSSEAHINHHKSNPQEVLARVHHLLEVGRAQAQNNGKIDDVSESSTPSSPQVVRSRNATPRHSIDRGKKESALPSTPGPIEPGGPAFESTPNQSFSTPTMPTPTRHQRRSSTSSNVSIPGDERSDAESDLDVTQRTEQMTINELREMYRKQDKTLKRYKRKFSEVVDAYKALHKDKEKLESTLTSGQDKQLRRISELKETIELEQEGKRHLEETLRLNLEEKDEQLHVLQTQVHLLKTTYGLSSPASDTDVASSTAVVNGNVNEHEGMVQKLQDEVNLLNNEIDKYKTTNEQAHATILRLEQEKRTAIGEVMDNMQHSITEQEDLKSELIILRDELNKRDITILQMREEEDRMENNLRHELSKEITEETLSEALKQQETELRSFFEEKEAAVKNTFADKVHDLQRILEENEKQKLITIQEKQAELTKANENILIVKEELEQFNEKEVKFNERVSKITTEKKELENKCTDFQQEIELQKAKIVEQVQQHNTMLTEKQGECSEQVAKIKRTMQTKVYDVQEQLRKKTQEFNETTNNQKTELESGIKEAQQQMQSDHAKASRKLEVKMSDMKKMIKELRAKLNEQESKCSELETSLHDAKTESDQAKVIRESSEELLNATLIESEVKLKSLNDTLSEKEQQHSHAIENISSSLQVELLNTNGKLENLNNEIDNKNNEILEWRCQHEELSLKCNTLTTNINELQNHITNKELAIKEIQNIVNEKDAMLNTMKEKESELESQLELLKHSANDSQKEQSLKFEQEIENIKSEYQTREDDLTSKHEVEFNNYTEKLIALESDFGTTTLELKNELENKGKLQTQLTTEQDKIEKLEQLISKFKEKLKQSAGENKEKASFHEELQATVSTFQANEIVLQNELSECKAKISSLEGGSKTFAQQLSDKLSELETLSKSLENANKEIEIKEVEFQHRLSNKDAEIISLNEKYEQSREELKCSENTFNNKISDAEEFHKESISKMELELASRLQEKDDELRTEMNKLMLDKDTSVESMSSKLEEMRKQELSELEARNTQRIDDLNNEWTVKLECIEKKHADDENKFTSDYTDSIAEKDTTIEKLTNDIVFIRTNQKELNDNQEAQLLNLINENERLKLNTKEIQITFNEREETVKAQEKERLMEHETKLDELRKQFKDETDVILGKHEVDIETYKSQIDKMQQHKTDDFNELSKTHADDRNLLLQQIEEVNFNLNQLKKLCDEKDDAYLILTTKLENQSANHIELLNKEKTESLEKVQAMEALWKDKQQNLEKKLKKVVADRKKLIAEHELKCADIIQKMEAESSALEVSSNNTIAEKSEEIKTLSEQINKLTSKIAENEEHFQNEISVYKSREQDAWAQLEQTKTEFNSEREKNEKEVATSESKYLESKNIVEELQLKVMSGESSSKEIDGKLSELLKEKNELEKKIADDEHAFEEKIRLMHTENDQIKQHYEETVRNLEDQNLEKIKSFEKEKEIELVSKSSKSDEVNKNKLLEMKKKAETKIAKMKKDFNEKLTQFESNTKELQEKISLLERQLEDGKLLFEKQTAELKEQHNVAFTEKVVELNSSSSLEKDQVRVELTELKQELKLTTEKLAKRDEQIDNMTMDKMDALKSQKADLADEHEIECKKIQEEAKKNSELIEKKLTAKVDEKDFEYSSKVKVMIKEFQSQLGSKDREIQAAVQEAIEVAQKDERRIITEYDEQIMDMQKELHLREEEMVELRSETEKQLDQLHSEKDEFIAEHKSEIERLEKDYLQRLDDLVKRHEEEVLNASHKDVSIEESEMKMNEQMNDIEKSYVSKIQQIEEQHRSSMAAQEKKYKVQMKKTKNEMRKLLAEKGVNLLNGGEEWESASAGSSNPGSDVEMDPSEVVQLKEKVATMSKELASLRQREKVLAMQAERSPSSPYDNRPATLLLDDSLNNSASSSPKTPQPLEFEYLRNILFNYMMGTQRKQMAKVLTALVHFSPSQVKQILAKVEEQETQTVKSGGYFSSYRK